MSTTTSAPPRSSRARALATLVLLASGARADVLHVPADFPTVAEALAAAQEGDEVVLAAGTYNTPIHIENLDGIVLRGQGKVVLGGGTALTPALMLVNCSNVTVDHLRIEGAQGVGVFAGPQANGLTLSRLRITGAAVEGIVAGQSVGVLIDRCRVEASGAGISILEALDFTLSRCTVVDSGSHGIEVSDVVRATVDRCRVTGTVNAGIALGFGDDSDLCVLSRNVVIDAGTSGLIAGGTDNVLTGNRVSGAAGSGLLVLAGSVGGIVEHNRLVDTDTGIVLSGSGMLVRDNRIVAPVQQGVVCGQDGCVLADNRVVKPGGDGYLLQSTMDGGTLVRCRVQKAGDDGLQVDGNGLVLTDNASTAAHANGFEINGTGNVLAGNEAHGSGVLDLEDLGSGTIHLDNDFDTSNLP